LDQKEDSVHKILALALASLPAVCCAQTQQLRSGSTVYIEPMSGYETYLAAAFTKKHVPLVIVADKSKADFIIQSTVDHSQPSQPTTVVNQTTSVGNGGNDAFQNGMERARERAAQRAALGSTSTSISVIDPQSSVILFSYSVGKSGTNHQLQSAAEACAKHLREFIEKPNVTR
jgi:hypothetical protein